jgi:hypothetical protein
MTNRFREIPQELRELAGEDFCRRAEEAAANIQPLTQEAFDALSDGPEVSGSAEAFDDDMTVPEIYEQGYEFGWDDGFRTACEQIKALVAMGEWCRAHSCYKTYACCKGRHAYCRSYVCGCACHD